MQSWRTETSCDTYTQQYFSYLLLKFDQTQYNVSDLWGVEARKKKFRFDPIWPPGMHKSVSENGENADLKTCRQRFQHVIIA